MLFNPRIATTCVLVLILVIPVTGIALAEAPGQPFGNKYALSAGGFFTDHETRIRLDSNAGPGTIVTLEDDLGLDATTNVLRLNGEWRFAERHKAHIGVFDLSQVGTRTLTRDLIVGGMVFDRGESVVMDWKMQLTEVGYAYRLGGSERSQWWFDVAIFVQDTALTMVETGTGGDRSSEDVVLPLPKFGISLDYAFTNRWIGHAGIDVFKLTIDDVGGSLLDLRATLDYRFSENFSAGAGWHVINVRVDLDRSVSGWQGRFDWQTRGLMLYGRLAW